MTQSTTEHDSRNRLLWWNLGSAAAGVLLALLATMGIVSSQSGIAQEQKYAEVIPYNG